MGEPPATSPASTTRQLPSVLESRIESLLHRLVEGNTASRSEAYGGLLDLQRRDLPLLRQHLLAMLPLPPDAEDYLRAVVTHVYLAEETYAATKQGYLGVTLDEVALVGTGVDGETDRIKSGKVITGCKPGLAAFRYFESGDIVLEVGGRRGAPATVGLSDNIKNAGAGAMLDFKVLRRGAVVTLRVKLSPRPEDIDKQQLAMPTVDFAWLKPAEDYWKLEFAPLFPESGSVQAEP